MLIVSPAQGHLRGLSSCAAHVPKLQVAMLSLIALWWQSRHGKGCAEILLVRTFWWLKAFKEAEKQTGKCRGQAAGQGCSELPRQEDAG